MRELPEKKRDATIDAVRRLLKDNNTCPFDFANKEQARVIAGEEEAAYAWVAVNFVDGALLEATVRSQRPAMLRRLHAIDATRVHLTMTWVASFPIFDAPRRIRPSARPRLQGPEAPWRWAGRRPK